MHRAFFLRLIRGILYLSLLINGSAMALDQEASDLVNDALSERDSGNVSGSINILSLGLENNPNDLRIKLELASSYFFDKNYAVARQLVNEVLLEDTLPKTVRENADRFLQIIEMRGNIDNRFLSKYKNSLNVFSGHDTNANLAPSDSLLDIGQLPESFTQNADDFYGLAYDFSFSNPIEVVNNDKVESLYQRSGISVYSKNYDNTDKSDLLVVSGRTDVSYFSRSQWYARASAAFTHVKLGGDSLVDYYRLSGKLGYQFDSSVLSLTLSTNKKNYVHSGDKEKEGYQFSQLINYRIDMPYDLMLTLNAENSLMNLNESSYSYHSNTVGFSIYAPLGNHVNLFVGSGYTKNKYRDFEKYYLQKRVDTVLKHRVQFELTEIYDDVGVELSYTNLDRVSNNDIHTYDRDVFMLSLKYSLNH